MKGGSKNEWFALAWVVAFFAILHAAVRPQPAAADEGFHVEQVRIFVSGGWSMFESITTIPGYHFFTNVILTLLGGIGLVPPRIADVAAVRDVNFFYSVAFIASVLVMARSISTESHLLRWAQIVFLPIFAFYYSLAYTDIFALFWMAVAFFACLRGQYFHYLIFGLIALSARQNHVFLVMALPFIAHHSSTPITAAAAEISLAKYRAFLPQVVVIGLAFVAFVLLNGGVAIGDQKSHQISQGGLDNIFFFLMVYAALFAPIVLADAGRISRAVVERPVMTLLPTAVCVALCFLLFEASHRYNDVQPDYFFRNGLIAQILDDPGHKLVASVAAGVALLHLWVTTRSLGLAVAIGVGWLQLMPSWLVEQRYYIPLLFLLLFLRELRARWIEGVFAAYLFALTFLAAHNFVDGGFFL